MAVVLPTGLVFVQHIGRFQGIITRKATSEEQADGVVPGVNERQLLEQAKNGEMACFAQIVEQYQVRVVAVALRILGDRSLAMEAGHETFVRLFRSLQRVDTGRPFFTYLYRIVVNVCRDLSRREQRRQRTLTRDEELSGEAHGKVTVAEEIEAAEFLAVVRRFRPIGPEAAGGICVARP